MASELRPFHLALPVHERDAASEPYCGKLSMGTGRSAECWIDLDFFGHQVTLHLVDEDAAATGCELLTAPRIRFKGEVGEQATIFPLDPSGNALEFKSFADLTQLFAH